MHLLKRPLALLLVLIAASMFVVACGDDDDSGDDANKDDAAMTEDEESDDAMSEDDAMSGDMTIAALAAENPDLSTLVQAATAAGLVETLSGEEPFTVFAPTNAAFEKLPEGTVENLLKPENQEQLVGILTYHATPGAAMAADLSDGQELTMANGLPLTVSIMGDKVMVGDATVVAADVKASNGVVHVIDTVLMPPADAAPAAAGGDAAAG